MPSEEGGNHPISLDEVWFVGDHSAMSLYPYQLYCERIDAAQNMRRFYTLAIQPTLFGGASVIRNWGRIGSNGQTMMETFDGQEDADRALSRLEHTKRKRGYRDAHRAK